MENLEEIRDRIALYTERINNMVIRRDDEVRERLKAGASVAQLVTETGLTRARIYQIRDRRR